MPTNSDQQTVHVMSGLAVAGAFPPEIQVASTFEAAMFTDAANPEGALALLQKLTSPAAAKAYADGGLISRLVA